MRIALGSDHRGYEARQRIRGYVAKLGHEALDMGVASKESCDYPDYAFTVAKMVAGRQVDRGILICGTGIGMCMAANKVKGIRAALCHDSLTAELSRRHNNANILCLSGDLLGEELMERMIRIWLDTEFEAGRHTRRVDKIVQFEQGGNGGTGEMP
jgi:ribose 5-phosphate isomerase B